MDEERHPTKRQRQFFQDFVTGEHGTILTVKMMREEPRGFAINIRGPFKLQLYEFAGADETVIDVTWGDPPESQSHLHCCWSEVRFTKLSKTNDAVRKNIGFEWQLAFFANRIDGVRDEEERGRKRLFWFYLKNDSHKAVQGLQENEVLNLAGTVGQSGAAEAAPLLGV